MDVITGILIFMCCLGQSSRATASSSIALIFDVEEVHWMEIPWDGVNGSFVVDVHHIINTTALIISPADTTSFIFSTGDGKTVLGCEDTFETSFSYNITGVYSMRMHVFNEENALTYYTDAYVVNTLAEEMFDHNLTDLRLGCPQYVAVTFNRNSYPIDAFDFVMCTLYVEGELIYTTEREAFGYNLGDAAVFQYKPMLPNVEKHLLLNCSNYVTEVMKEETITFLLKPLENITLSLDYIPLYPGEPEKNVMAFKKGASVDLNLSADGGTNVKYTIRLNPPFLTETNLPDGFSPVVMKVSLNNVGVFIPNGTITTPNDVLEFSLEWDKAVFGTPGIHVFCLTCFKLSRNWSSATIVDGVDPASIDYRVEVLDNMPPPDVWIHWDMTGVPDPSLDTRWNTMQSLAFDMTIPLHYMSQYVEREVNFKCTADNDARFIGDITYLSKMSTDGDLGTIVGTCAMQDTIYVIKPLESVNITVDNNLTFFERNVEATFVILLNGAKRFIKYSVTFEDTDTVVQKTLLYCNGKVTLVHTYTSTGNYTIRVNASQLRNDDSEVFASPLDSSLDVTVLNRVANLILTLNGEEYSDGDTLYLMSFSKQTTVNILISVKGGDNLPSHVTCDRDRQLDETFVGDMLAHTVLNMQKTFTIKDATQSLYVHCWNQISEQNFAISIRTSKMSIDVTDGDYIKEIDELIFFTVSSNQVQAGMFMVMYGDGMSDSVCLTNSFNATTNYSYPVPGEYQVSAMVLNALETDTGQMNNNITVQKLIHAGVSVTFNGSAQVFYPSNTSHTLSIYMDRSSLPPSAVTCNITYSPQVTKTLEISNYTHWLVDDGPIVYYDYIDHEVIQPNVNIDIFCWNLLSNISELQFTEILRSLEDIKLQVDDLDMQDRFIAKDEEEVILTCFGDGQPCYVPNTIVRFKVTALYGAFPTTYVFASFINMGVTDVVSPSEVSVYFDYTAFQDGQTPIQVSTTENIPTVPVYHKQTKYQSFVIIQSSLAETMASFAIDVPTPVIIPSDIPVTVTFEPTGPFTWDTLNDSVSCTWLYPNGFKSTDFDPKLSSSSNIYIQHTEGPLQKVKVMCSNYVSRYNWSQDIHVHSRIVDLKISLVSDSGIYTKHLTKYNITGVYGESPLTYLVFANDTLKYEESKTQHKDFDISFQLLPPGTYNVYVMTTDAFVNTTSANITVIVEMYISQMDMKVDRYGTLPPGILSFGLIAVGVDGYIPTKMSCIWNLDGHPRFTITDILDVNSVISAPNSVDISNRMTIQPEMVVVIININVSLDGSVESGVNYTANVTCSNHVSNQLEVQPYHMQDIIEGVECVADMYVVQTGEDLTFTVSRGSGTAVTYRLGFENAASEIFHGEPQYTADDLSGKEIMQSLKSEGFYNVTCHSYNDAQETSTLLSPGSEIEVQRPVKYLKLEVFNLVQVQHHPDIPNIVYSSEPTIFAVTTSNQTHGISLTTYLKFSYGDGDILVEKVPMKNIPSGPHYNYHKYPRDSGQVELNLRAFNNISEQTEGLAINVTIMEVVSLCSFTTDKKFAKVGEDFIVTVECEHGSHMDVVFDFDGDRRQILFNVHRKLDKQEVSQRSKTSPSWTFWNPGNYTVSATASNWITKSIDAVPPLIVTTQYMLPELKLHLNGPILTPPGLMEFNLSTPDGMIYTANDVTCIFDYGDGSSEEFYYYPDMDLPVLDLYHTYTPNRNTIQANLTVKVTCRNDISEMTTAETVAIINNEVFLADLTNNGPVLLGSDYLSTLKLYNYGKDTCFLWTYTNISHSVLFGREDCKLRPNFNSYQEFIEIVTEQEEISYTVTANVGPIFEVYVLAENSFSSDSKTTQGLVLEKPCYLPDVNLGEEGSVPTSPRQIYFAEANTLYGMTSTSCSYTYSYIIEWEIYEYNDAGITEKGLKVPLNVLPKADLTLAPHTVPLGTYVVGLTTTIKGLPLDIVSDATIYLNVVHTPLIVAIVGGRERLASVTDNFFVVDASTLSEDPDLNDILDKSNMTWKWLCQETSLDTELKEYNWTLNSGIDFDNCNIPSFQSVEPGILSLPTAGLTPNSRFIFTVLLSKPDGRQATYSQLIHTQEELVLDIHMKCQINCKEYVNPDDHVRYLAECLNCNPQMNYTWEYQQYNEVAEVFNSITLPLEPYIATDGYLIAIDFPPKTFFERMIYRLKLIVSSLNRVGSSTTELKVNSPPRNGYCEGKSVQADGTDGNIKMTVLCHGWRDDEEEALAGTDRKKRSANTDNAPNLKFEVSVLLNYMELGAKMLLSHGRSSETSPTFLPAGDPLNNYTIPVYISIADTYGTAANTKIDLENNILANLTENMSFHCMRDLRRTAEAGDIQTTVAMLWTILSMHETGHFSNYLNATKDILDQLYSDHESDLYLSENTTSVEVLGYYILQLSKLMPEFPNEIRQVTELLKYVAAKLLTSILEALVLYEMQDMLHEFYSDHENDPFGNNTLVEGTIIDIIVGMIEPLQNYGDHFTVSAKHEILQDLLATSAKALIVATKKAQMTLYSFCTAEECQDGFLEQINNTNKDLVVKVTNIIDALSDLSLLHSIPEEDPVVLDGDHIIISSQRIKKKSLQGYSVQTRLGGITLPYNKSVYENVTSNDSDVTFWTFEQNPFVWDIGSYFINVPTNQIKVKDSISKEPQILLATSYADPFHSQSFLKRAPDLLYTQMNNTATDLAFHTFWLNDTNLTPQLFFDIGPLKDVTLQLYIIYNDEPNVNKYDYTTVLPEGMPDDVPTDTAERNALLSNLTQNFTTSIYSLLLPKEVTQQHGLYTVAVFIISYDEAGTLLGNTNYTFYVQYVSCSLWFSEKESWTDDQCEVSGGTSYIITLVVSVVFPSSFGAGLFVAPNTISFGTVYDDVLTNLRENIHVVVTVLLFIILYIALVPLAFRKDRTDKKNWTALPVLGVPIPEGYHKYIIDVYTGFGSNSGTDANVYITLVGDQSETEAIHLDTPDRKNFVKGQLNRFIVGSKMDLGKLCFVHVWHDSNGEGGKSDWYLDKIIVTSVSSKTRHLFLCEKWLSLNKENCKTDQMLRLASKYELFEVKQIFKKRVKSLFLEDNLWISTFMRREIDSFTRVQRITAAIAIVFLAMISNAMWYGRGDSDTPKDGIQIGPLSLTLQSLMVSIYSVLTMLPVSLLIIIFFTKSKPRKDYRQIEETLSDKENKQSISQATQTTALTPPPPYCATENETLSVGDLNANNNNSTENDTESQFPFETRRSSKQSMGNKFSGRFLPFWCAHIAFVICLISIALAAFFTVTYSFEWGGKKSAQWLTAFCLCFFESEGLLSPLKAVALALIFAVLCKQPQDQSDEYFDEEDSFYFKTDEAGDEKLLQERLEKMRFRKWLENELNKAFRIFIWQALFIISLALVVFGNADANSFKVYENLMDTYSEPATEVASQADLWDYVKDIAIPATFLEEHYNGKTLPTEQTQFLTNRYSKRLGPPGLRQFRVEKRSCAGLSEVLSRLPCINDYSRSSEEKNTFKQNWITPTNNITYTPDSVLQQAFDYDSGDSTNFIYHGYYNDYYGRGYSVPLGSNLAKSVKLVEDLITSRWMDHKTRAVAVEFNVYNANINLFTLVNLLFEFPSVGGVLLKTEIKSVKLYRYIGGYGVFALVAESCVFVFIVVLSIRIIYQAMKQGKEYFKNTLNLSEVLKVSFGVAAIISYVTRTVMIQATVTRMLNNRDESANFRGVILVDEMFLYFIGFTLFIQILQLLWIFKFNKSLAHLSGTLKYTFKDIMGFFLAFCGIFIGFSILYYDTYGTLLWDYRTFLHTFYSNVSSILGHFRTAEYEEVAGLSGRLLFIGFMTTSVFFYLNMLVVIIVEVYEEVKSGELDIGQEHKVRDLIVEKLADSNDKSD